MVVDVEIVFEIAIDGDNEYKNNSPCISVSHQLCIMIHIPRIPFAVSLYRHHHAAQSIALFVIWYNPSYTVVKRASYLGLPLPHNDLSSSPSSPRLHFLHVLTP